MKKILLVVGAVVIVLAILAAGFFPVARVNGDIISYRSFDRYRSAFLRYQSYIQQQGGQDVLVKSFADMSDSERDRALLEGLISQTVIHSQLDSKFRAKAKETIDQDLAGRKLDTAVKAAKDVYGLSFERFSELFLLPVAEENVMRTQLLTTDQTYDEWLTEALRNATVKIYFYPFRWENGALVQQ